MFKFSLHPSAALLAACVLSASCLSVASVKAQEQKRIPDYGNMVITSELRVTGFIDSLAFTPDSSIVIASEKDHFLTWNSDTGEPIRTIQGPENIRCNFILFTSDGKTMITAGSDAAIRVWDFETGKITQTLEGHRAFIMGLALSPSGKLLASTSADRSIRIWDVETGKQVHELSGTAYPASVLIFSQDEKKLTSFGGVNKVVGFDRDLVIKTEGWQWNLESGEAEDKDVLAGFGPPYAVTSDGTALIGSGEIKTPISSTQFETAKGLRRYNIVTKELGNEVLGWRSYGYRVDMSSLKIAPNKAVLAIGFDRSPFDGMLEPGIYLWNGSLPQPNRLPRIDVASAVMTFSPDSRKIATWRDELKVKIFTAP